MLCLSKRMTSLNLQCDLNYLFFQCISNNVNLKHTCYNYRILINYTLDNVFIIHILISN